MFFIVIMNCQKLVKPTKKDMHSKNARLAAVSSAITLPIIKLRGDAAHPAES